MKEKDKGLAILLGVILDLCILYLLYFKLIKNKQDLIYTYLMLFIHLIYYYGVYYNITYLIDITHITLPLSFLVTPLLKSTYIKILNLSLLIVIQLLWVFKGYCILSTENIKGCGDFFTIIALLWSLYLLYDIIYPLT